MKGEVQSLPEFLLTQPRKLRFRRGFLPRDRRHERNLILLTLFQGGNYGGHAMERLLPKTSVMMTARCGGPPTSGLAQTEVS
jgi:hypothetical protein